MKYIIHIDIAIAGISIVPLAVHSIFNEKLENNMAPNKLIILFNFNLNNKYAPILAIGKNIPVTVNIATWSMYPNLNIKEVMIHITGDKYKFDVLPSGYPAMFNEFVK
nr:hypothetical protein [Methanobrevibacter arboriphilus]